MLTDLLRLNRPASTIADIGTFSVSLAVAELFFKFGSFSLECIAFLLLWAALRFFASRF